MPNDDVKNNKKQQWKLFYIWLVYSFICSFICWKYDKIIISLSIEIILIKLDIIKFLSYTLSFHKYKEKTLLTTLFYPCMWWDFQK